MDKIEDICEEIVDAILLADCSDVIYSWLAESGIRLSNEPRDPRFKVFKDFYECAERLHQEYLLSEIEWGLERFPELQRRGKLLFIHADRTEELKMLRYCLQCVHEGKDAKAAFYKRIN